MKIVIDIPESTFSRLTQYGEPLTAGNSFHDSILSAVAHGTVLPKEHGRLVDGDLLDSKMYHAAFETDSDMQKWDSGCWIRYKLYENIRDEIPVLVKAER